MMTRLGVLRRAPLATGTNYVKQFSALYWSIPSLKQVIASETGDLYDGVKRYVVVMLASLDYQSGIRVKLYGLARGPLDGLPHTPTSDSLPPSLPLSPDGGCASLVGVLLGLPKLPEIASSRLTRQSLEQGLLPHP